MTFKNERVRCTYIPVSGSAKELWVRPDTEGKFKVNGNLHILGPDSTYVKKRITHCIAYQRESQCVQVREPENPYATDPLQFNEMVNNNYVSNALSSLTKMAQSGKDSIMFLIGMGATVVMMLIFLVILLNAVGEISEGLDRLLWELERAGGTGQEGPSYGHTVTPGGG